MSFEITKLDPEQIEDIPLVKRVDFINDNLLYKGYAAPGSLSSAAVWRIVKIVIGNDGDVAESYANGDSDFINIWDNRLTLTYI